MKKSLVMLLVMLITIMPVVTVCGADAVTSVFVTMDRPEVGKKPPETATTGPNASTQVIAVKWEGNFDENGCFKLGEDYTVGVMVEVKPGKNKIIGDSAPNLIKINEKKATLKYANEEKTRAALYYTYRALGVEHKHCYCGGELNVGDHTSHEKNLYKEWNGTDAVSYQNNVAYVYLSKDITRSETLNIANKKKLYLCLNGHTLGMNGDGRVVNISSGGKLYLCDCSAEKTGKITGGKHQDGGGIHNGGTMYMFGGSITGNKGTFGGGLWNNYSFYMYGGAINENMAGYGGGVWNANSGDAELIMYEGSINQNKSNCGGGLWNNDNGNFVMKAGEFVQNEATYGGGIWNQGAHFTLEGGYIYQNQARYGGGVWNQSTMIMTNGFVVANQAIAFTSDGEIGYGGGIWNNGESLVRISGGEVSGNYAGLYGGGIFNNDTAELMLEGGMILGNQAEEGGGIYIQRHPNAKGPGVVRMYKDALVRGNVTVKDGSGVYVKGVFEKLGGAVYNNTSLEGIPDIYTASEGEFRELSTLPTQFIDVPADAYYLEPVLWAIENNITEGTSDITFSPDDTCNMGQVLTFLWRAYGSPEVTKLFNYADVYKDDYFYMAAQWGKQGGMVDGVALYPNFSCSRIAAINFMWIAAGRPACDKKLNFTDVKEDSPYYTAVAWAVDNGITSGTSETTFSPSKTCTRAEIITFLWRNLAK